MSIKMNIYCGIIKINSGSIFVVLVGSAPHKFTSLTNTNFEKDSFLTITKN